MHSALLLGLLAGEEKKELYLPYKVDQLIILNRSVGSEFWAYARKRITDSSRQKYDIDILSAKWNTFSAGL